MSLGDPPNLGPLALNLDMPPPPLTREETVELVRYFAEKAKDCGQWDLACTALRMMVRVYLKGR